MIINILIRQSRSHIWFCCLNIHLLEAPYLLHSWVHAIWLTTLANIISYILHRLVSHPTVNVWYILILGMVALYSTFYQHCFWWGDLYTLELSWHSKIFRSLFWQQELSLSYLLSKLLNFIVFSIVILLKLDISLFLLGSPVFTLRTYLFLPVSFSS